MAVTCFGRARTTIPFTAFCFGLARPARPDDNFIPGGSQVISKLSSHTCLVTCVHVCSLSDHLPLPYGVLSFTICIYYMPAFKYAYEQLAADQEGRMKTDIQMVWTNLIF